MASDNDAASPPDAFEVGGAPEAKPEGADPPSPPPPGSLGTPPPVRTDGLPRGGRPAKSRPALYEWR